jgi:hypothetical protein
MGDIGKSFDKMKPIYTQLALSISHCFWRIRMAAKKTRAEAAIGASFAAKYYDRSAEVRLVLHTLVCDRSCGRRKHSHPRDAAPKLAAG